MPGREPRWWYDRDRRAMRTLLQPVASIYGAIARRRLESAPSHRSTLPVICVGNFTAGGTGKTPLTTYLVQSLLAQAARPAILIRGYGGRTTGPHWVNPASDFARDVGDEPLQHATSAPTLVARDRAKGARAIEGDPRGFTHILMDDGLQNPSLAKSLSFALIDGRRGLGNGAVIPAGPLRAPLDAQLRLADAIIVNHGFVATGNDVDRGRPAGLTDFDRPIHHAMVAPVGDLSWLTRGPIVAFAGIGAPDNFFAMLRALGATLAAEVAFGDHHTFSDADAGNLLVRAKATGALLVTTEKDVARLSGLGGTRADLRVVARPIPIRMRFASRDAAQIETAMKALVPERPTALR